MRCASHFIVSCLGERYSNRLRAEIAHISPPTILLIDQL